MPGQLSVGASGRRRDHLELAGNETKTQNSRATVMKPPIDRVETSIYIVHP